VEDVSGGPIQRHAEDPRRDPPRRRPGLPPRSQSWPPKPMVAYPVTDEEIEAILGVQPIAHGRVRLLDWASGLSRRETRGGREPRSPGAVLAPVRRDPLSCCLGQASLVSLVASGCLRETGEQSDSKLRHHPRPTPLYSVK
jgi:hypothetical protein